MSQTSQVEFSERPSQPTKVERERRVPPHTCSPLWIDKLIDSVRDVNPPQITRDFITVNIVGSGNQGKILVAAEFLGLVDEDGKVTDRLRSLRVVGEEFTANLARLVREAYPELVNMLGKSATWTGLINLLMQKYDMNQPQADGAARLFLHLSTRAGLELGETLAGPHGQKPPPGVDPSRRKVAPTKRVKQQHEELSSTGSLSSTDGGVDAILDCPVGNVRIVDMATLDVARRFLDILESQIKARDSNSRSNAAEHHQNVA